MDQLSFEERLNGIREISDQIESGKLPLEESVKKFESGMQMLSALEKELQEMKRKITLLQEKADGSVEETPAEDLS